MLIFTQTKVFTLQTPRIRNPESRPQHAPQKPHTPQF